MVTEPREAPNAGEFDDLVQRDRVHRRVYADPAIFDEEMRRIFNRTWVYVGHESEVAQPGDYKLAHIGRQPVILSRAEDGAIHVLYNRCPHRGATVCQEKKGHSNFFRCVYHGWTFSNCGDLVGYPWPEGYPPETAQKDLGLARVPRVASYRGFIFASASPEGVSLEEHLGEARPYIDLFADVSPEGALNLNTGAQYVTYAANWKFQMENGVDGYHTQYLHQSYFKIRRMRGEIGASSGDSRNGSLVKALGNGHALLDRRGPIGDSWFNRLMERQEVREYYAALEQRFGTERAKFLVGSLTENGFNLAVYPNLIFNACTVRTIRPVAVDRTEVVLQVALLAGVPDEVNALRLRAHEEFYGPSAFAAPDDMDAFERVQEGLKVDAFDWLILSRGLHREQLEGNARVSEFSSDETPMRGQFAQWKHLMSRA